MSRPPLAGVRILAVSQFGAGPFGTSLLAGLGAEIQSFNRGKKSLTLNLRHPDGQAVLHHQHTEELLCDVLGSGERTIEGRRARGAIG